MLDLMRTDTVDGGLEPRELFARASFEAGRLLGSPIPHSSIPPTLRFWRPNGTLEISPTRGTRFDRPPLSNAASLALAVARAFEKP